MFRLVFHLSVVAIHLYASVYDQLYVNLPFANKEVASLPFRARTMFLIIWCLILQTIYFSVALLNDIFGSNAENPKRAPIIRKMKDTLFSLAFPIAIYVSLAFWGIYNVDKDLIFPDHIERLFPKWLNHVMHTTVAIFIIIELLSSYRNYPSRRTGTAIMVTFSLSYIVWIFVIHAKTGVWVYPILDHLTLLARAVFITVSVCVAIAFYLLGEKLNHMVCGTASPQGSYVNGKSKSS